MRVLIVEDDPNLQKTLRTAFTAAGNDVLLASTGREAIDALKDLAPDVAILDLGLPDMDGKDVLGQVRAFSLTPILVLSARDHEREKIASFDLGANAYMEKPFVIGELMARVRAVLRDAAPFTYFGANGLSLDMRMRWVKKNGVVIKLSRSEYDILVALARRAGRPLTHDELCTAAWGDFRTLDMERLRVAIRHLRVKIEEDPSDPKVILTAPGVGYLLADATA